MKNLLISFVCLLFVAASCGDSKKEESIQAETPMEIVQLDTVIEEPIVEVVPEVIVPTWPKKVIVQKGEWIYDIARREYGSIYEWKKIYDANKDMIQDPNIIYPGQELTLPE